MGGARASGIKMPDVIQRLRDGTPWAMQDRRQLLNLQRLIDGCYESAKSEREIGFLTGSVNFTHFTHILRIIEMSKGNIIEEIFDAFQKHGDQPLRRR